MRLPSLFASLAFVCASCATAPPATLRVMTFNIHAGKDAAGVANLERVASLIAEARADVVLLQEVDRRTKRSGGVDQFDVLTRLTGMHGAFGKSLDYDGGEYGIAVLSRSPITRSETVSLVIEPPQPRAGGSYEPRVALIVESRSLPILNTHLDASRDEGYRLQEVEQVLARVTGSQVVVAGGDFNAEPASAVYDKVLRSGLRDVWASCGSGAGLTYPAKAPAKRIDYVFLDGSARCLSARVIETQASDHLPLIVELALR